MSKVDRYKQDVDEISRVELVLSIQGPAVIRIKVREAIEAHHQRTGERMTYARLADATGLARATIESIATRADYNATLDVVERLCRAFSCTPCDLLELVDDASAEQQES